MSKLFYVLFYTVILKESNYKSDNVRRNVTAPVTIYLITQSMELGFVKPVKYFKSYDHVTL